MQYSEILSIGTKIELINITDDKESLYPSYIKDIEKNEIMIDQPPIDSQKVYLSVGNILKIIITTDDAVYSFKSGVIRKQLSPINGVWIRKPYKIDRMQRRKYLRVNANLPLLLQMIDKDGDMLEINVKMRDLSGGGVSFYTNEDLRKYIDIGRFYLTIDFNKQLPILKVESVLVNQRVVKSEAAASKKAYPEYICAFAFLNLEEYIIDELCKFCFQYQLELKRKGLL